MFASAAETQPGRIPRPGLRPNSRDSALSRLWPMGVRSCSNGRMSALSGPARARVEVLLGALAFAASVPAGKLLLRDLPALALSGGLYIAAGLFSLGLLIVQPRGHVPTRNRLKGREWWWLVAAVICGGVLGPLALFNGLRWSSGYVDGLLLNFEAVFTIGLGAILSRERVGPRGLGAIALVVLGGIALSTTGQSGAGPTLWIGALLVVAACACWGLDNNFTQRISLRDARQIVAIKGLAGGATNLILARMLGQLGSWNSATLIAVALVGAVSYGFSIVL